MGAEGGRQARRERTRQGPPDEFGHVTLRYLVAHGFAFGSEVADVPVDVIVLPRNPVALDGVGDDQPERGVVLLAKVVEGVDDPGDVVARDGLKGPTESLCSQSFLDQN